MGCLKGIRISQENYYKIDKIRETVKGKVTFDDAISYILKGWRY